jgi:hypothetical protein
VRRFPAQRWLAGDRTETRARQGERMQRAPGLVDWRCHAYRSIRSVFRRENWPMTKKKGQKRPRRGQFGLCQKGIEIMMRKDPSMPIKEEETTRVQPRQGGGWEVCRPRTTRAPLQTERNLQKRRESERSKGQSSVRGTGVPYGGQSLQPPHASPVSHMQRNSFHSSQPQQSDAHRTI